MHREVKSDEIWQLAVLREKKSEQQRDPLVVLVPNKSFSSSAISICKQSVLGTYDTINDYMRENGVLKSSSINKCRFPQVVTVPVDCESAEEVARDPGPPTSEVSQRSISLYLSVTREFLDVYSFFDSESVWFRPTQPYPLDKVALVPTRNTAQCTSEHLQQFVAQLYAKVRSSPSCPVIVHTSFDYYHPFVADSTTKDTGIMGASHVVMTFHVMETLPHRQGSITEKTKVTILPPYKSTSFPLPSLLKGLSVEAKRRRFSRTYEMEDSGSGDTEVMHHRVKSNSASDLDQTSDDSLRDDNVFNIPVVTVADFKLLPHFIVMPKDLATSSSIFSYQHVTVTAVKNQNLVEDMEDLTDVVLPLTIPARSPDSSMEEEEEEDRSHYAIAVPYDGMAELERYVPRPSHSWDHDRGKYAFVHPELLFYLFPETLSLSRSCPYRVTVSVRRALLCLNMMLRSDYVM